MAIARYETVIINTVTNGVNNVGEYTTTTAEWFTTRGLVADVTNTMRISDRYRSYSGMAQITLNYTPNTKLLIDDQEQYSITWRDKSWRIADVKEHNDRQSVTLICYQAKPSSPV